jgi:hypothetical protein
MDIDELIGFIRQNGVTENSKPYLKQMMIGGVTPDMRKFVWMKVTGADKLIKNNRGYYDRLLEQINGQETYFSRQITRDLHRTFPDEIHFKSTAMKNSLARVLFAYSHRNPNIGY